MKESIILIVDDQRFIHKSVEKLLSGRGYNLAFASNGEEALAKAGRLMPDLVLLDVMMPGMDGFEVCRRLRAHPLLAEVPILIVTALDNQEALLKGIEAGADGFLPKPFNPTELRTRVRTIIRLNRYRRLLAERTKFEWVVAQADDGYLVIDESDHIRYANHQARLYLDLSEEVITETFLELVRGKYTCRPEPIWADWPNLSQSPYYLIQPETETANAFWLQVYILRLPGEDRIIRLRDITEQMAAQRDMRGFHEMIRHKLRTPLVGMVGNLELLARHSDKLSKEEMVQFAQTSLRGAKRLHSQVEDILQYMDASGLVWPDLAFRLDQLESMARDVGAGVGLADIRVHLPEMLRDVSLRFSSQAMEIILWEILENAHKFHPTHTPRLTISVTSPEEGRVHIRLADDGLTLSPEQLRYIWNPYYQGEKHFTGEVSGMGLGLSTVAALVWNVGGMCDISNREGQKGVVVALTLPMS